MKNNDPSARSLFDSFGDDPASTAIAALIRDLEPGERLPSERNLAEALDISRTALRDRLGILEGLGVLRRRSGAGTFVEVLKHDALAFALNLAISSSHLPLGSLESVRIALERQAAAEAAERADPVLVAYMKQAVDTMSSESDPTAIMAADRAFHQALLRAAGNPALTFFADALADVLTQDLADRSERLQGAQLQTPTRSLLVEHHLRIHTAIEGGDAHKAMQAVDDHFNAIPSS